MAGSYNHVITNKGNLASNQDVVGMLENGGDVFEAVEEMYGMIWWLARKNVGEFGVGGEVAQKTQVDRVKAWVEEARQNYQEGLKFSKEIHKLSPDQRRD